MSSIEECKVFIRQALESHKVPLVVGKLGSGKIHACQEIISELNPHKKTNYLFVDGNTRTFWSKKEYIFRDYDFIFSKNKLNVVVVENTDELDNDNVAPILELIEHRCIDYKRVKNLNYVLMTSRSEKIFPTIMMRTSFIKID